MEVQDGFIVGIFNYCDRWCETCAFTARCRVFADVARHEADHDPSFKALIETPPHAQDVRTPAPWLAEMIEEVNEATRQALETVSTATVDDLTSELPEPYRVMSKRAKEYAFRVHDWWRAQLDHARPEAADPRATILWFSTLVPSKIYRALSGLAEFDGDREFPPDHEGSAKVALIGIERSMAAWRDLVSVGGQSEPEVGPFLNELNWLRSELVAAIPRANEFVRPGFDEPDEVRRLEASGA
jgi:hypothetical protein